MKTLIFCFLLLTIGAPGLRAQTPVPAVKGVAYGTSVTPEGAITVTEMEGRLEKNRFEGKIRGKVTEVCQEKGCWMKMENSKGEKLMVKFKDYAFFMPKDIVGKEVVLDGEATVNKVSVKQQKHYAEDAGKSPAEIATIKSPKKEMQFEAKGVLVL